MTNNEFSSTSDGIDRVLDAEPRHDEQIDVVSAVRDSFKVEITSQSLDVIAEEVRIGGSILETGGILLGRESKAGCLITLAGGPGPAAIRKPLSFSRDLAYAESLADQAWNEERSVWLGEWHTHPHSSPVPSETDMASYARHLADPDLDFDTFISIIVGKVADRGQDQATLALTWVVNRDGARTTPLLVLEETNE